MMKAKTILFVLIISLVPFFDAFSQEKTIEGEISATGKYVGVKGEGGGEAKFTEYRDLQEDGGLYGRGRLNLDTEKYFLKFDAGDFGYDTQYYRIDGGMWGKFKYELFYDGIPHNFTFDARTPFPGAGHDTLTGAPNTNIASWDTFDYSILRHQYGGGLKMNMMRPFFFDVSFQREERDGIKPTGASQTSPGGVAFELPEPVQYLTNNLEAQAGYAQKPLFLALNYFYSDFNNSNSALNLPPNFNVPRALSLPPDNTYQKGAFKGAVTLPLNSRFSTNIGVARGRSETSIVSLIASAYKGQVDTLNYDAALTSNPIRFFDAKVYYKYYKRNNESDDPTGVVDLFLDYKINTYGADLGFRLPLNFHLTGGYKNVKTSRDRVGETDPGAVLPFNRDNIYSVGLKWSGVDFMDVRLGYEKFDRDAKYQTEETAVDPSRFFSYAAQNKDTYKVSFDIFPLENLNFGFEYQHKNIDYSDTIYGLLKDKRHEFDISTDYAIGKIAKLYGYSDYGLIKFVQMTSRPAGTTENEQKDNSYGYGLGTEVYVIPKKLTVIFQHDYLKSNGNVDLTYNNPGLFADAGIAGANNDIIDVMRWDDYTKYSFKLKSIYHFTKSLSVLAGYGYETFSLGDAQLDGYQYVVTGGSNAAYLTGAYKDQSYRAHLIFAGVAYKF
jgi:MtrB/PioB family decaheme-associated outer membrane protein